MVRENRDDGLQSLRLVFDVLPLFLDVDLPSNFEDIKTVNVYAAHGDEGDDWKAHLDDQGQAWIITPLHYTIGGSNKIRSAAGGGRWLARDRQLKKHGDTYWYERKYKFKVESTGLPKYTMIEHTPREDKPKYALCQITVDTKKSVHDRPPSSSQQPKRMPKRALCQITVDNENYAHERPPSTSQQPIYMEIEHTDSNNGDKDNKNNAHDRPLSSSQQQEGKEFDHGNKGHKGGNIQNTAANYNQQILERKLRELRKHHSYADICKVLDQIESEKLPAASPKEHSTEARVRNTKRGRCTLSMEAGTSIQGQEQVKVEMLESNSYGGATTNLHDDTSRNCIEFGEQSSHHGNCNEKNAEPGSNPINLADFPESFTFDELCSSDDHEMAEQNAVVQEPNQLSHNFNANSTVAMDYHNRIEYPSTSNFATTMGRLDHQMVQPNTHFQEPKLYYNINGNSTEPVLNNNHILSWNRNISAPGPSTSNYAAFVGGSDKQNVQDPCNFNANLTEPTENGRHLPFCYAPTGPPITDQGTYNAIQEQQFPLCNTPHGQMLELDAYVLEPNYHNINAPGPSTSNWRTTEPENMDLINNMDLSKYADIMDFINN